MMDGTPLNGAVIDEIAELDTIFAPFDDTQDGKEHLTHIINPPKNLHIWRDGMTSKDVVGLARLAGIEIEALCGYRWVPKRNPDKYPICMACMDIAQELIAGKEG